MYASGASPHFKSWIHLPYLHSCHDINFMCTTGHCFHSQCTIKILLIQTSHLSGCTHCKNEGVDYTLPHGRFCVGVHALMSQSAHYWYAIHTFVFAVSKFNIIYMAATLVNSMSQGEEYFFESSISL